MGSFPAFFFQTSCSPYSYSLELLYRPPFCNTTQLTSLPQHRYIFTAFTLLSSFQFDNKYPHSIDLYCETTSLDRQNKRNEILKKQIIEARSRIESFQQNPVKINSESSSTLHTVSLARITLAIEGTTKGLELWSLSPKSKHSAYPRDSRDYFAAIPRTMGSTDFGKFYVC